jgi:hypothetical protein
MTNLSINPNTMVLIPYTRKRDIRELKEAASSAKQSSCPMRLSALD